MLIGPAPDRTLPPVIPPPAWLRTGLEITRRTSPAIGRDPADEHDPSLLVAALEDIHRRQLALEWLRDADLFRCLF